ncbi:MAG: PHP domain-containing protein [Candidatus Binatia bacterium]|nr:PHP domain-containing protein [Candidatus Binatia bacterium]
MILDLHLHSELSDDSRAKVETYLKILMRKREERPLDGIVVTEHRRFDLDVDYRALEDQYELRVLRGAEVESEYGHILLYGVNEDILGRFDFTDIRLPAQEVISEVERLGGIATPCHPGRSNVGLCAHYESKPALEGVIAVEALNGGSKGPENDRVQDLMTDHGYFGFGGSDSHLASFIGICATDFEDDIADEQALVSALKAGRYKAVDFRPGPG